MKLIKDILTHKQKERIDKKANEMFSPKCTRDEYKSLKEYSLYFRVIAGFMSIFSGLAFVYYKVILFSIHTYIAFLFSLTVLIAVELFKHKSSITAFKSIFENKYGVFSVLSIIFTIVSSLLSFLFSVEGVKMLHEKYDSSIVSTEQAYKIQKDSINLYYNTLIDTEKYNLKEYKEQVSWKGQINIYNKTNQVVIQRAEKTLVLLYEQKRNDLSKLEIDKEKSLLQAESKYNYNFEFWVVASVSNEVIIILLVAFVTYYYYRVHVESSIIKESTGNKSINELRYLFEQFNTFVNTTNTRRIENLELPVTTQQAIGFQQSTQDKEHMDNIRFLEKYKDVVKELEKGTSQRQIPKICNVSKSTVQNVQRVRKALQQNNKD
jgi:hypothetical protein